jgi:rhomboid family GlyGly-CTERM serine protease
LRAASGWLALCALAAAGSLAAWFGAPGRWRWQPELAFSEPWRWWTAACVHLSAAHLMANLGAVLLLATLGVVAACGSRAALAWALAWPLTQLGLLLQPELRAYGGLSGLMHAGVAVACWQLLRAERGRRRAIGAALFAGLIAKLLLEAPWSAALRQLPGWDIAIAPLAHSSGAAAGLLCAWACGVGGHPATGAGDPDPGRRS